METSLELVHLDAEKAFNELIMLEKALQDIVDDSKLASSTDVASNLTTNSIITDSTVSSGDGDSNESYVNGERFSKLHNLFSKGYAICLKYIIMLHYI